MYGLGNLYKTDLDHAAEHSMNTLAADSIIDEAALEDSLFAFIVEGRCCHPSGFGCSNQIVLAHPLQ